MLEAHRDDFTFCGLEEALEWIAGFMGGWFDIKVRGVIGGDPGDAREITILGRKLKYTDTGIEFEGDPKHRRLAL